MEYIINNLELGTEQLQYLHELQENICLEKIKGLFYKDKILQVNITEELTDDEKALISDKIKSFLPIKYKNEEKRKKKIEAQKELDAISALETSDPNEDYSAEKAKYEQIINDNKV